MTISLLSTPTPRRIRSGATALLAALLLTGCATEPEDTASPTPPPPPAEAPTPPAGEVTANPEHLPDLGLPVDTVPEVPGGRDSATECPYLDTQWVADTNGQRMTGYGIDERFDIPACVYWSYPEEPQATVMIRTMPDAHLAMDVVDWAAPIDATELAESPPGWSGGRGTLGDAGAVYAVAKGNLAVVVWTNQEQSFKAQQIAEESIAALGL